MRQVCKMSVRTRLPPDSRVKVSKTSVLYETSFKGEAGSRIRRNTFCSPGKQFCNPSPSKSQPLTHQSQCHSDTHLHETSQPHDCLRLRLPRKVRISHVQSCSCLQQNLHTLSSTKITILAKTCHESECHSHIQHPKTTTL